jgi:hypothetical protein
LKGNGEEREREREDEADELLAERKRVSLKILGYFGTRKRWSLWWLH